MDYNTIMSLYFYDMQNILESYAKIIEDRNKEEQKQAKEQGYDPKDMNPKDMMNNAMNSAKGMMPKMPTMNMPGFK